MRNIKNFVKKLFSLKNAKWLALIIIIIIVIIFFAFRKHVDTVVIEEHNLYQFLAGIPEKIEYTGKIVLDKNEDITRLTAENMEITLDSTPVYYKDENRVIFPKNMAIIRPKEGKIYRVNYFTNVYKELDDLVLKDNSYNGVIKNSVLYDGNDLYFLMDDSKVTFGDKTIELDRMSYVLVDPRNRSVDVYNRSTDTYEIFDNVEDEVIISTASYKVNATYDLYYFNDNSRLILKDINKLSHLS